MAVFQSRECFSNCSIAETWRDLVINEYHLLPVLHAFERNSTQNVCFILKYCQLVKGCGDQLPLCLHHSLPCCPVCDPCSVISYSYKCQPCFSITEESSQIALEFPGLDYLSFTPFLFAETTPEIKGFWAMCLWAHNSAFPPDSQNRELMPVSRQRGWEAAGRAGEEVPTLWGGWGQSTLLSWPLTPCTSLKGLSPQNSRSPQSPRLGAHFTPDAGQEAITGFL